MKEPTLSNLTLIIWTDRQKVKHELKILRRICDQSYMIGILLDLEISEIDGYMQQRRDDYTCCTRIFKKWIDNGGLEPNYPKTWKGLCSLLHAIDRDAVESELLAALASRGIHINRSNMNV